MLVALLSAPFDKGIENRCIGIPRFKLDQVDQQALTDDETGQPDLAVNIDSLEHLVGTAATQGIADEVFQLIAAVADQAHIMKRLCPVSSSLPA